MEHLRSFDEFGLLMGPRGLSSCIAMINSCRIVNGGVIKWVQTGTLYIRAMKCGNMVHRQITAACINTTVVLHNLRAHFRFISLCFSPSSI